MGKFGKRRSGPWYAEDRARLVFEGHAGEYFPGLRSAAARLNGESGLRYLVDMEVPYYETRRVLIFFGSHRSADFPVILADGPTDSPHRYPSFDRHRLCIWYVDDPAQARWTLQDGLLSLLGLIKLHLFREAWRRETGGAEWPGPEVTHSPSEKSRSDD